MSDQRLTLYVPDVSALTSMNLGAAWNGTPPGAGTAWNGRGLCVNSVGRIWLDAHGTETGTSSIGALSNAAKDDAKAGLLFQSLSSWVYSISKQANITSSNGSVFIAGGSGVKIVAGHGAPILPFGIDSGTSTQLQNVAPDNTQPSSSYADTYSSYLDEVALGWAITDTVVAAALTVLDVAITVADTAKPRSWTAVILGSALSAMGRAANLAGMGVNIAGMAGGDTPGIQIHASSNVNFATTGFCSIHSGAGMLLFGALTTGLGFLTAGVTGFVDASLKACLMTGVEGDAVSVTAAGGKLDVSSKSGKLYMTGASVQIGANLIADTAFAKSQMLTDSLTGEAIKIVSLEGLDVGITSAGDAELEGGVIDVDANTQITIRGAGYCVKVMIAGIEVSLTDGTMVEVTGDAATLDCQGAQSIKVDAASVTLGSASTNLKIDASGSNVFNAPAVTLGS